MIPVDFKKANCTYGKPKDMHDSQCRAIRVFRGNVHGGSIDGVPIIVTAWKPTGEELALLNAGDPIYLTFLRDGLPPHMVTMDFVNAIQPT